MEFVYLKDYVEIQKKSTMNVGDASNTGEYPFFNCSEEVQYTHKDYMLDGEYVILSTGGSPNLKLYNGKFNYSSHVLVMKADNNDFLYSYLLQNIRQIEAMFKGNGLKNLELRKFYQMKIFENEAESTEIFKTKMNKYNKNTRIIKVLDSINKYQFLTGR